MLFLGLTVACSPPQNSNATNNNAPAADAASPNASPVTAQPATPMAEAAPPVATATPPSAQPATPKPATATAAPRAPDANAAHVNGPKLVVVSKEKDLDFGKQPQDMKLVRPIRIKNNGTQTLNIESVSPG